MKVLALFDYVARTGFGTVSKNVVRELKKAYGAELQLDIIAINYFGEPYHEDENTYVVSAKLNDFNDDSFGLNFFLKTLKEGDYDGVFIIQDLGVISPIIEVMDFIKKGKKELNLKSFKSIFYFPVDCELYIKEITKSLEFFDMLITYTEFGRKEILKLRPDLKVKVISHGNNHKDFYPISKEEIADFRKEYFGVNADKFILTNVNRNQPRKDLMSTIFGFIEASEYFDVMSNHMPNIAPPFLYLHCHPKDPLGHDLRAVFKQTDLIEDVDYKLLPKEYEDAMVEVELLNKIYNASDAYISTTLGEGFGLGFLDAASCKLPIIAPYNTSFIEMSNYGQNAYMLESSYPYCGINDNVVRQQTDIYEIGEMIIKVMTEHGTPVQQAKINASYEWSRKIEWSIVCKAFIEYFKIFL